MPIDPWLAIESVGFLIALALVVYGVAKLDIRLMATGGVVAGTVWLLAAWSSYYEKAESERRDCKTLHIRVVDQATSTAVRGARIQVVALDDTGQEIHYRLPATTGNAADGTPSDTITVSLFVNYQVRGSLIDQFRHADSCLVLDDQMIEVVAPSYSPWRGSLKQLLSDDRQSAAAETPIVIEMRSQEMTDEE
jgi:hypothetical protein